MKRLKLLLIVILGILVFTGCNSKKTSITGTDFSKQVGGIVSLNNYSSHYGLAKQAYQTDNTEYKVLFVEGNTISDIKGMYIDEVKNVYAKAGIVEETSQDEGTNAVDKKYTKRTAAGKNWSSIEITTDISYYYLIYVDNTLLYLEGNIDKKDILVKVKDTINY